MITIQVNARVMITTNIDLSDRLINGQISTVKYISINQNEVNAIYVAFDNVSAGQIRINGNDLIARNNKRVPIKREETSIYTNKNNATSPAINNIQFRLALSWACTVHKVQGLSLNSAVISFGLEKQKLFSQEKIYVASSCVPDVKNLHLMETYNRNAFQVNSNVTSEYKRLRDSNYFIPCSTLNVNSSSLTVSLLNTRSLSRHIQDILKDKNLMENDLLCLTVIQFCHENDVSDIKH